MKIDFQFDKSAETLAAQVNDILTERAGAIRRVPVSAVRRGTFELLALVQENAPKKTSTFVRSLTALVEKISEDITQGRVGSPLAYAQALEQGTGIYGPAGRPITILPTKHKALFWGAYDGNGKPLIRKKAIVQGMKPRAPFANALAIFIPRYQQILQEEAALI